MVKVAFVVAFVVASVLPSGAGAQQGFGVGERVQLFTLKAINAASYEGGSPYISLDDYFGAEAKAPKKALLMSFFATYCEPCKREMPFLAALQETYRDKGLQILIISIDKEKEKIEIAKALADEAGVKFPVLSDRFNIVARRYFVEKLPNVYVVDGGGKVAFAKVGYGDDVSRELLDVVRKNLGESTSAPVPAALSAFMAEGSSGPVAAGPDTLKVPAAHDGSSAEGNAGDNAVKATPEKQKRKKRKKRKKKRRRRKGK